MSIQLLWLCGTLLLASSIAAAEGETKITIGGLGLSASGFLITYQLGVIQELLDVGAIELGVTPMAGASGGALVAAACGLLLPPTAVFNASLDIFKRCGPSSCREGELGAELDATLAALVDMGEDWTSCNGVCYSQVSLADDFRGGDCIAQAKRGMLIGSYDDEDDLLAVLSASSFLPNMSVTGQCATELRNCTAMDGAFTNPLPCPPVPPAVDAATAGAGGASSICLRIEANPLQVVRLRDALGMLGPSAVSSDDSPPDIYPGLRGNDELPMPLEEYVSLGRLNGTAMLANAQSLFDAGREDARHWLSANGWEQ